MNGQPAELIDRWEHRAEPAPGEGLIYWHMLLGGNPDVGALANDAQQRLAPFAGLHMTPLRWLHITALIAGPAAEITGEQIQQMAAAASQRLAKTAPIQITLGTILYHPEAIMLAAQPAQALLPILQAAREATNEVTGTYGRAGNKLPWTPHITICYSQSRQPAAPIIDALGHEPPPRQVKISAINLVSQQGPERHWDWHPAATIQIGDDAPIDKHG